MNERYYTFGKTCYARIHKLKVESESQEDGSDGSSGTKTTKVLDVEAYFRLAQIEGEK
jgi:hypothetical protein